MRPAGESGAAFKDEEPRPIKRLFCDRGSRSEVTTLCAVRGEAGRCEASLPVDTFQPGLGGGGLGEGRESASQAGLGARGRQCNWAAPQGGRSPGLSFSAAASGGFNLICWLGGQTIMTVWLV